MTPPEEVTDRAGRVWQWVPVWRCYRHDHAGGTVLRDPVELTLESGPLTPVDVNPDQRVT